MMRLNFLEAEWVRLRAHMATTLQRPPMDRWSGSTSHGKVLLTQHASDWPVGRFEICQRISLRESRY